MVRALEIIAPLIEFQPEIRDNFDGDQMARDIPDIFGSPQKWLRDIEQVGAIREQRQQQEALQMGLQAADTGSQVVERLVGTATNAANGGQQSV